MQFSVIDLWTATGPIGRVVVLVLVAMSIASIAVGVERLLVLRRAGRSSSAFLDAWRAAQPRPWGSVVEVPSGAGEDSPAAFLLRALGEVLESDLPPEVTERAYDRTMRRILLALGARLRRGLGLLATVGSTAPFVGLFGTVAGIVNAFHQMAVTGQGGLATVSGGIAEALVTTALGILTAIPALWLFNAVTGGISALLTDLECAAEELAVDHLGVEYAALRSRTSRPAAVGARPPRGGTSRGGRE
jgi:biopolymer transport protein ExbB/TolQ